MTLRLAPGVHVVRRDERHLQVGLDPPARVIVPDSDDVVDLLETLRRGTDEPVTVPSAATVVRSLDAAGLVARPVARPVAVQAPRVTVVDRGLGAAPLLQLLRARGLDGAPDAGTAPDLVVVTSPGPLPRAVLDDWVHDGTPHLVLAGTGRPGSLRLGPLVVPGVTACQRCVDAAESAHDPRRSLVLEQLAVRPAAPLDPALVTTGLGWAAREAAAYAAGERPLTWSTTVDLDGRAPSVTSWERHPHCGCVWDQLPY